MPMSDQDSDPLGGLGGAKTPSREAVMAALSRILSSPEFIQSDRLKRFLTFIVEETLDGRTGGLKEYTIGLEVFDRDDSFDPQTNSIVRVEASRLRAKLEKYNATTGRDDPAQITLPAGSYVPAFIAPAVQAGGDDLPPSASGKRQLSPKRFAFVALALAVFGGAIAAFTFEFGNFDGRMIRLPRQQLPTQRTPLPFYPCAIFRKKQARTISATA